VKSNHIEGAHRDTLAAEHTGRSSYGRIKSYSCSFVDNNLVHPVILSKNNLRNQRNQRLIKSAFFSKKPSQFVFEPLYALHVLHGEDLHFFLSRFICHGIALATPESAAIT